MVAPEISARIVIPVITYFYLQNTFVQVNKQRFRKLNNNSSGHLVCLLVVNCTLDRKYSFSFQKSIPYLCIYKLYTKCSCTFNKQSQNSCNYLLLHLCRTFIMNSNHRIQKAHRCIHKLYEVYTVRTWTYSLHVRCLFAHKSRRQLLILWNMF